MRYRRFGRTGWNVSEIGYGMWGMAGWTGSDDKESLGSLQSAIDLGCNFFDTAWAYGNGHSEELLEIGRAHVELQSPVHLVCRLLLEKKKKIYTCSAIAGDVGPKSTHADRTCFD